MTVTVRAIAQRQINRRNAPRVIMREIAVGLMNGIAVAAAVGVIAGVWFADLQLSGVIAAALIFNVFCAGFLGATLPMVLDRFGADPAVATSVFLTALTDVIGFLAFLGLASWWFSLG